MPNWRAAGNCRPSRRRGPIGTQFPATVLASADMYVAWALHHSRSRGRSHTTTRGAHHMRRLMLIAGLLVSTTALAIDPAIEGIKGSGGYGAAGCGLGSMAFNKQPGIFQILAATTNSLTGTQTFGITSGTSNCGPSMFAAGTRN